MITNFSNLLRKHPNFYILNAEKKLLEGSLILEDTPCNIQLHVPNFPKILGFSCKIHYELDSVDISNEKAINRKWSVEAFLDQFPTIWKSIYNKKINCTFPLELEYGAKDLNILNQILICQNEVLTGNFKMHTNANLTVIKFDEFTEYEGHYLQLKIKDFKVQIDDHSLPNLNDNSLQETQSSEITKSLFNPSGTILEYLQQFLKLQENFDLFYKYLNTLDELCWVVEPAVITTKQNWRMFKLAENVFVKVTLNPLCPSSVNVNIYGPTLYVERYRAMYAENIYKWDPEQDVYRNLLKIFDLMVFPCNDQMENEDTDSDSRCNICLSYLDDNGHIPICSCDNKKCKLVFHVECLKLWFANSVEGRTFLSVAMGVCPICKEKLSASFRSLLDE